MKAQEANAISVQNNSDIAKERTRIIEAIKAEAEKGYFTCAMIIMHQQNLDWLKDNDYSFTYHTTAVLINW